MLNKFIRITPSVRFTCTTLTALAITKIFFMLNQFLTWMILKIPRADEQNQLSGVFAIVNEPLWTSSQIQISF